jgi:MarR family transcriptional regulator for hemolysin
MSRKKHDDWKAAFTWTVLPAGRAWQKAASAAFTDLGVSLSVAAPVLVLARLGPDVRQKAVADAAGIDPAAVVRSLDQLEKSGILRRTEDPQDRRAKTLRLTEKGEQLADALENALAQVQARVFAGVSKADGEITTRVLTEIMRASDEFAGNP